MLQKFSHNVVSRTSVMIEPCENLEEVFDKFSSEFENKNLTNEQSKNLSQWFERKGTKGITISQIDNWMQRAQLTPKPFRKNFNGEVFFRLK
jgi:hypothetical protein